MNFTPQGLQIISELARRYAVSEDAVMSLLQAVINGGGSMAQFSHPELGGSGQWMQGGMTMVGDMFNNALKAKVDGLCAELSRLAATQPLFTAPAPAAYPGNAGMFMAAASGGWWPAELGTPSATGSQNQVRYAIFPATQRLAIEHNGQITVYDTLNHQIGGISQQQGYDASLTFTSQFGLVQVSTLPILSGGQQAVAPTVFQSGTVGAAPAQASHDEGDIFSKIERLAELHQKGVLSEQEFAQKKAELMSRL